MAIYWFIKRDGKREKLSREEALVKMNNRLFDLGEGSTVSEMFHDCPQLQAIAHSKQQLRKMRLAFEENEAGMNKDDAKLDHELLNAENHCDQIYEMIQLRHLSKRFQKPGDMIKCRADGSYIIVE